MALSQSNIHSGTPMGSTLIPGGATFKVWGPLARAVYVNGVFGGQANWSANRDPTLLLSPDASGYWTGFRTQPFGTPQRFHNGAFARRIGASGTADSDDQRRARRV
jgi:hypothetical protein